MRHLFSKQTFHELLSSSYGNAQPGMGILSDKTCIHIEARRFERQLRMALY
jgi:hypothetical protein